jgi:ABC-2 type transport system permease protein
LTVLRAELFKLAAQLRVRILVLVCLLGPVVVAFVLGRQSGLPKDTLFGRHVHESGYALPLVILGFAGTWGFPLLTSLVAGDIFSAEDAHGTWPSLLTRSRSRSQVFTGKVLTSALVAVTLLAITAATSTLAGVALSGSAPLVSLSGTPLSARHALVVVAASWLTALPPLLGFTALACLLSVVSRSSVIGVGGPVVLGLVMQLLGLLGGLGDAANALLTTPFASWHGLVRQHPFYGPLWQGSLVSLVWAGACVAVARRVLLKRDVT